MLSPEVFFHIFESRLTGGNCVALTKHFQRKVVALQVLSRQCPARLPQGKFNFHYAREAWLRARAPNVVFENADLSLKYTSEDENLVISLNTES